MSPGERVVIVGGGIAGLTTAAYLAQAGVEVELFEQHYRLGGCCTSFKRRQFIFDAAVHGVGGCTPGGILHDTLKELGVWDRITMLRSNPMDVIVCPHYSLPIWTEEDRLLEEFRNTFPKEIDRLARLVHFLNHFKFEDLKQWGQATLRDLLDHYLQDDLAKTVFIPPLANLGMSSRRMDAITACSLWRENQLNGGYAPLGSFQALADMLGERIVELGGKITLRQEVSKIGVDKGQVVGVQTQPMLKKLGEPRQVASRFVVGAGAVPHMYLDLIGKEHLPGDIVSQIEQAEYSLTGTILFMGFKDDIHAKMKHGGCHWYFEDPRLDEVDGWVELPWIEKHLWDKKGPFYMALPTHYDKTLAPPGKSLGIVIIPGIYGTREYWKPLKEQLAEVAISRVESLIPDVRQHIEVQYVATSSTMEWYTRNTQGGWYGWAQVPGQSNLKRMARHAPVAGLYLAGHWTRPGAGMINAMKSGQLTAKAVLRDLRKTPGSTVAPRSPKQPGSAPASPT